jgi:predicted phage-related endonuclease
LSGDRVLEIKCPFKRRDSTLWKTAAAGRLPEHYQWQVQHQLMVTKAEIADVYVFDGAEGLLVEVQPQPDTWQRVHDGWDAFMRYVREAQAPPLTARDTRIRDDPEWLSAAAAYLELRAAYDELSAKCDEAKSELVGLASHAKERGGGISVTRLWKRGSVDYRRVPALATVDLEQYRGPAREETRVQID